MSELEWTAMFVDPKSTICVWYGLGMDLLVCLHMPCLFASTRGWASRRLICGALPSAVYSLPSFTSRQILRGISIVILIAD